MVPSITGKGWASPELADYEEDDFVLSDFHDRLLGTDDGKPLTGIVEMGNCSNKMDIILFFRNLQILLATHLGPTFDEGVVPFCPGLVAGIVIGVPNEDLRGIQLHDAVGFCKADPVRNKVAMRTLLAPCIDAIVHVCANSQLCVWQWVFGSYSR
jgi:hypothetical protein